MTMTHPVPRAAALACAALLVHAGSARAACDKQPVKAERVQAVGLDMLVNGVPTSVRALDFAGSADDVSSAFREFWTQEDVPAKGVRGPNGLVLSALDGACLYVLTIPATQDRAPTKGVLSVAQIGERQASHAIDGSAIPLPEGTTVSDIESRDPGQAGRTWLIQMSGNASDNARRYASQLAQRGWSTVAQAPAFQLDGSKRVLGSALAMQRGNDRLDVVFTARNGQTEAVINATRNR
ncbi:hypothetical protein SAMN05192564_10612 [Paraburkholderia sartisoli]|uniref:Lipoprotein n=2 Tax=Paraburkholderia sartisoli TaxID=83784 RepID=A0A1H4GJ01_9BURK|nr:hypothetical protein SAMN05192564_10612 [Paraburkholderia sartisoli]